MPSRSPSRSPVTDIQTGKKSTIRVVSGVSIQQRTSRRSEDVKLFPYFEFKEGSARSKSKWLFSAVGTDGAVKNLQAEATGKSFDTIRQETNGKWENALSVIDAEGSNDQLSMLCHIFVPYDDQPVRLYGCRREIPRIDHNIHQAEGFTNYTVFSVRDTYRALHPLFNIIKRDVSTDLVKSMLAHYSQSVHHLPPVRSHMGNENWCMIGYHWFPSWPMPSPKACQSTSRKQSKRWSAVQTCLIMIIRMSINN